MAASIPFTPGVLIDIESLVVGNTEVWINPVRIEHDSLRKIENVLVEEWHFDVGMSIVEFDRAPKISARDWYAHTGFEVFSDVTLEIVEQDEEFAVGRRKKVDPGIKVDHVSASILKRLEGRFNCF